MALSTLELLAVDTYIPALPEQPVHHLGTVAGFHTHLVLVGSKLHDLALQIETFHIQDVKQQPIHSRYVFTTPTFPTCTPI